MGLIIALSLLHVQWFGCPSQWSPGPLQVSQGDAPLLQSIQTAVGKNQVRQDDTSLCTQSMHRW